LEFSQTDHQALFNDVTGFDGSCTLMRFEHVNSSRVFKFSNKATKFGQEHALRTIQAYRTGGLTKGLQDAAEGKVKRMADVDPTL
jgi:hypothetical protein